MQGRFPWDAGFIWRRRHKCCRWERSSSGACRFTTSFFTHFVSVLPEERCQQTQETWRIVGDTVKKDGSITFDPMFREHYLGITIEMTTGVQFSSDRSSRRISKSWESCFRKDLSSCLILQARNEAMIIIGIHGK